MVFPGMWELDCEESWAPKNLCFWTLVLEKTLESPLDCKEIQLVHSKGNQFWMFIWRTDVEVEIPVLLVTWCEELTHLKRPGCWERLKTGGKGDDRGWDGWMASPTQWTWVWVNSGSWWWTGRPSVLQSLGSWSQIQLSDWTELSWTLFKNSNGEKCYLNINLIYRKYNVVNSLDSFLFLYQFKIEITAVLLCNCF